PVIDCWICCRGPSHGSPPPPDASAGLLISSEMLSAENPNSWLRVIETSFSGIGLNLVVAMPVGFDMDHLAHPPSLRRAFDGNDEIHGLADHLVHRLLAGLGGELLETPKRRNRIVGVDRGDAAGMPGVPGFEQCECCAI